MRGLGFAGMPSIDAIAAEYVDRAAALDPFQAALAGIDGHDHEVPDLSPDGFAERAGLERATLTALDAAEAPGHRDQAARAAMQERLSLAVERYDAGDTTSELNVIASWVQDVRELFDLMPAEGEEAAANVARRMAAVPQAYRQLSQTLLGAARNGRPPARLQVEEVARQCAAWSEPENSFYCGLVQRLTGVPDALRGELDAAARAATAATAGLGAFLSAELLPLAREKDACGPEVYARASRSFLGAAVDLQEAGRHPGRGRGDPGQGPGPAHRRAGELPRVDAGTGRAHHLAAARDPLRHPGTRAPDRGHDRPRR